MDGHVANIEREIQVIGRILVKEVCDFVQPRRYAFIGFNQSFHLDRDQHISRSGFVDQVFISARNVEDRLIKYKSNTYTFVDFKCG